MAERWRYAERPHPPYCTCVNCRGDGPRPPQSQPSNQLRAILEKWRSKNFDPHFILGVPPDSSRKLIVEAHRRWIIAYHPDRHNNDPTATELTKSLNAARDELLGIGRRASTSQREQWRRQEEAQRQREREAERQRQEEERQRREREAEELAQEAARIREEDQLRGIDEVEQLVRQAARRHDENQQQSERASNRRNKDKETRRQRARDAERKMQDEKRERAREAKQRKQERAARRSARKAEKRQRREEDQRQRANNAEQQRRQEEARRQGVREAERLIRDAPRQPRTRHSNHQGPLRAKRIRRLKWEILTVALLALIFAYLVLTIESPDAVDDIIHNWARLFDQALARQ